MSPGLAFSNVTRYCRPRTSTSTLQQITVGNMGARLAKPLFHQPLHQFVQNDQSGHDDICSLSGIPGMRAPAEASSEARSSSQRRAAAPSQRGRSCVRDCSHRGRDRWLPTSWRCRRRQRRCRILVEAEQRPLGGLGISAHPFSRAAGTGPAKACQSMAWTVFPISCATRTAPIGKLRVHTTLSPPLPKTISVSPSPMSARQRVDPCELVAEYFQRPPKRENGFFLTAHHPHGKAASSQARIRNVSRLRASRMRSFPTLEAPPLHVLQHALGTSVAPPTCLRPLAPSARHVH